MAPSGQGQMMFKVGGWGVLGFVLLVIILCSVWELYAEEDRALAMEERILHAMEGRQDGHNCGRNLGGMGDGGPGVDSVAVHLNGVRGEDLGEKWLCMENSSVEVRSLTCLEGELGSTLLFEHRGGKSPSPMWVACILLGIYFMSSLPWAGQWKCS